MADFNFSIALDAVEAIRTSERLTNSFKNIDSATRRLNNTVGTSRTVFDKELSTSLERLTKATTLLKTAFSDASKGIGTGTASIGKSVADLKKSLKDMNQGFVDNNQKVLSSIDSYNKVFSAGEKVQKILDRIAKQARITTKDTESLAEAQKNLATAMTSAQNTKGGVATVSSGLSSSRKTWASGVDSLGSLENDLIGLSQLYDATEKRSAKLKLASAKLADSIAFVTKRISKMNPSSAGYDSLKEKLIALTDTYAKIKTRIDTTNEKLLSQKERIVKVANSVQDLNSAYKASANILLATHKNITAYSHAAEKAIAIQNELNKKIAAVKASSAYAAVTSGAGLRSAALSSGTSTFISSASEKAKQKEQEGLITSVGKAARSTLYGLNAFRIAFNLAFAASGIGAGTKVVADFDQTLADLKSIIQDTGTASIDFNYQMAALKSTMEELGATSRYTTSEAGQGMIYMAQSGLEAGEVVAAASHVIDLAVASNTSLARSADIVVQAMRTFNIQAKDAWQVTDTLAMGAKASVTSIEQLAQAMKFVGPIAHTMGVRIDTVVAALGTLSDSGLQASMAGTGLRRIISEIVNPTQKARKILDSYGLTIDKLDIQGLGLVTVLENIREANIAIGDSFAIWGDRGTPALQTIMTNFDKFQDKLNKIKLENIQGTARSMRDTREDTITGQIKASVSAIQEFIIKFSEYTGLIDLGKESLRSFAETLREYNAHIGFTVSGLAKWGAAAVTALVAWKAMNGGLANTIAAVTKFSRVMTISSAITARTSKNILAHRTDLDALSKGYYTATMRVNEFAVRHRAAAVAIGALKVALRSIASIGIIAVLSAAAAGIAKVMTSSDEASSAIKGLSEFTALYWKGTIQGIDYAKKALDDYKISILSLSDVSLALRKKTITSQIQAIEEDLKTGNLSNLFGDSWFKKADIGQSILGISTQEILDMTVPQQKKLLEDLMKNSELAGKIELLPPEQAERFNKYIEALKTLVGLSGQFYTITQESERRLAQDKTVEELVWKYAQFAKNQKEIRAEFTAFSDTMNSTDYKKLGGALDSVMKKEEKLKRTFSSETANDLYNYLNSSIKNFDRFFDFDPATLSTKLKESLRKALDEASKSAGPDAEKIKKQLKIDDQTINQYLTFANQLAEIYKSMANITRSNKYADILNSAELEQNLVTTGKVAEEAKKQLMNLYNPAELKGLKIDFQDTFAAVMIAEGQFSDATVNMANDVAMSLEVIYKALNQLSAVKFSNFIKNRNILEAIPKKDRKNVQRFVNDSGIDISNYNPETGTWGGFGGFSGEEVTAIFKKYVSDNAKEGGYSRVLKTMQQIKNEQVEMQMKYKQYLIETTTGSSAELAVQKLRIEKQKEINSVMEKAASLNLSAKDTEIKKTLDLIDATYKLKEAEALRAAQWEKELTLSSANLTIGQRYGASNYAAQMKDIETQMRKAEDDRNQFVTGSVGWINANAKVQTLGAKRDLTAIDAKIAYGNVNNEYANAFGNVNDVRQAEASLLDFEIQKLQLQQKSVEVGGEEYKMLQKQIELKQLAKDKALDQNMFAAVPETINKMKEQYSEWNMMSQIITQSFDMMTESIVNFITTGEFSFSEFTKQVGTMLVELTTKVMMFKAITSLIPGLKLADGGLANVIGFADGGITQLANARKFARGGMLTSPTMFNTSSGLALAGEAGYEHLMPAARLSNGKWGVYAEGMGGNNNQFVINTNITVDGGSTGNREDDNKLAATISEKVSQSIKDTVKAELVQQMRAGGLLNSNGNRRW